MNPTPPRARLLAVAAAVLVVVALVMVGGVGLVRGRPQDPSPRPPSTSGAVVAPAGPELGQVVEVEESDDGVAFARSVAAMSSKPLAALRAAGLLVGPPGLLLALGLLATAATTACPTPPDPGTAAAAAPVVDEAGPGLVPATRRW